VSAGDLGVRFWSVAAPPPVAVELRAKAPASGLSKFLGADHGEHFGDISVLAFTPDGRGVVTGSSDRTVRLWDSATGRLLKSVTDQQVRGQIQSVAFAPDGKTLYFGTGLNTPTMAGPRDKERFLSMVHRWDLESGSVTRHLKGFSRVAERLALARDGKRLMVVAGSEGLELKDDQVSWSHLSGQQWEVVSIWDAQAGVQISSIQGNLNRTGGAIQHLSPDGKLVLMVQSDAQGNTFAPALYDADTGKLIRTLTDPLARTTGSSRWDAAAFSPDGRTVVAQRGGTRALLFWDAATGQHLGSYQSGTKFAWGSPRLAFAPDSKVVAVISERNVFLVDAATRTELRMLRGHEERITSMAFSPDGARLLTGSEDGSAILWNVASGAIVSVYKGHAGPVKHVAYSPDGMRVATASGEHFARVWPVNLLPEFERRKSRDLTAVERQRYELNEQGVRK
jgi:WD40 repeat protein